MAAERVYRGSTTTRRALLCCLASITHLKPQGWASAALPPMISTRSALRMSTQWLVIAPRPNVGARLATVGPCQTRAWLSKTSIPRDRIVLCVMYPVSFEEADAQSMPVVIHRLTILPSSVRSTKFSSRSAFIIFARRDNASSQLTRFHSFDPGSRISGYFRRLGLWTKSSRPAPLGHSVPRLTGWSGSPSIWKISGVAFFALSPRLYMSRPQLTEQYGQVLRVSTARASLNWRVSASAGAGENPSAVMVEAASPAALACRNCLRVMSMGVSSHSCFFGSDAGVPAASPPVGAGASPWPAPWPPEGWLSPPATPPMAVPPVAGPAAGSSRVTPSPEGAGATGCDDEGAGVDWPGLAGGATGGSFRSQPARQARDTAMAVAQTTRECAAFMLAPDALAGEHTPVSRRVLPRSRQQSPC